MKTNFSAAALLFILSLAPPLQAQEAPSPVMVPPPAATLPSVPPVRLEKARRLAQVMQLEAFYLRQIDLAGHAMMSPMHEHLRRHGNDMLKQELAPFFQETVQTMAEVLKVPEMVEQTAARLAAGYTDAELEGLIAFYASPLGQKTLATLPAAMQPAMDAIRQEAIDYSNLANRHFGPCLEQANKAVLIKQRAQDGIAAGKPFPDMAIPCVDGSTLDLTRKKGRFILLVAWVMQSEAWNQFLPELRQLKEKYQSRGLDLVGFNINYEEELPELRKYLTQNAMPWPVMLAGTQQGDVMFQKIQAQPDSTFLIAPDGTLLAQEVPYGMLAEVLEKFLPAQTETTPGSPATP